MNNQFNQKECILLTHNITFIRQYHRLSKKEMARLLRIGVNSLTKLEKGIIPPRLSVEILFYIEDHFGISPADMLGCNICESGKI